MDQLVIQHPGALERDQGQGRLLAPVELDCGRVADLEGVPVGQDSQPHAVLVVGDLDQALAGDGVVEAVGAFAAEDITAAFFQLQGLPCGAVAAGRHGIFPDELLAHFALDRGLPEDLEFQLLRRRLAFGVDGLDGGLEGFAGHVDRPDGAHGDGESAGGQDEIDGRLQVSLGQLDDERQHLGLAEVAGGEFEADLALWSVVAVWRGSPAS